MPQTSLVSFFSFVMTALKIKGVEERAFPLEKLKANLMDEEIMSRAVIGMSKASNQKTIPHQQVKKRVALYQTHK